MKKLSDDLYGFTGNMHERALALEARVAELEAWQLAIAEGTGFINRAEGQSGYEVADPKTILDYIDTEVLERIQLWGALTAAVEDCSMSMAPDVMALCLRALGREPETEEDDCCIHGTGFDEPCAACGDTTTDPAE